MKRTLLLFILLSLGLNYGCSSDKKKQNLGSDVQSEEAPPSTSPTGVESDTEKIEMEDQSMQDQKMEDSNLKDSPDTKKAEEY